MHFVHSFLALRIHPHLEHSVGYIKVILHNQNNILDTHLLECEFDQGTILTFSLVTIRVKF